MGREMLLGRDWPGVEELTQTIAEAHNGEAENCMLEEEMLIMSRDQLRNWQQDD